MHSSAKKRKKSIAYVGVTATWFGNFCTMSFLFLLPLPYYRKVMEVLFSVKIFDVEFSPDLYVLMSPESKKVVFGNWSVSMYVCVCVCVTAR